MLIVTKNPGETMDQLIKRIKQANNIKKVAYVARLDPMARGVVPLLVDNECAQMQMRLHTSKNKIYQVKIIIGIKTDTDDPLGLIIDKYENNNDKLIFDYLENINNKPFDQNYHYYSTKMLNHRLKKNYDTASHVVSINDCQILNSGILNYNVWSNKIINQIKSIDSTKNFRQEDTINQWLSQSPNIKELSYVKIKLSVSSGFFVRQFIRDMSDNLKIPLMCYSINRTHIL